MCIQPANAQTSFGGKEEETMNTNRYSERAGRGSRAALAAGLSLSLGLSLCLAAPVAARGAGDGMAGALGARVA